MGGRGVDGLCPGGDGGLAGPFADEGKLFGIAIVDASSGGEARAWMEKDPAVQAGFFDHEIHPAMLPALDSLRIRS